MDLIYFGIVGVFLTLSLVFIHLCDHLGGDRR